MKTIQRLSSLLAIASLVLLQACSSGATGTTSPVGVGTSTGTSGGSGVLPLPGTGGNTIINSLPLAVFDVAVVQVGSTANPINVLLNDTDANGDSLSITATSLLYSLPASSGATAAIAPDGKTLRYTPPAGFVGTQSLRYTVSDGHGGVSHGIAVITVSPLALPPAALPDVFTKLVDAPSSVLNVLANDVDGAGGGLVVSAANSAATVPADNAGTVSVVNGALHYQPAAGFFGVETLVYTLRDANGATATAVAVITVLPLAAPPLALPEVVTLAAGASGDIDVLANDVDLAGGGLTLSDVTVLGSVPPGDEGSFAIVDNRIVYTPASPTFIGTQTASYSVADLNGSTATGLLTLVVTPIAPTVPPLAVADLVTLSSGSTTADLNVLTNDIDVAGDGLTITAASVLLGLPDSTGVSVSTDGTALQLALPSTYAGVLTLSYTITDGNGSTATAAAIVAVAPAALPDVPPVAIPDVFIQASGSTSTALDVLANDIDVAGGGLTITAASVALGLPDSTGVSVGTTGTDLQLTLPGTYAGVLTLNYTATDSNGGTSSSVAVITVTPAAVSGIPPLALPDVETLSSGSTSATLSVLTNDLDVAGGGLTITAASVLAGLPDSTGVSVATDGSALQLALPGTYSGVLTLSYTITDSNGSTSTTAVIVTVAPAALPAVPPVPLPDLATVLQDSTATTIDLLANDVDPAAGGLTLSAASTLLSLPVASHTVAIVGNQLEFTPAAGFAGVVTVTYTVTDTNGATGTGLVVLTVSPISPIPLPLALNDLGLLQVLDLLGTTGSFDVLANDIDPAGGGLTLQSVNFQDPLLATVGSLLGIVGNQVELTVPLLGLIAGVLPIEYVAIDSLGRTVTGVLNVTLFP